MGSDATLCLSVVMEHKVLGSFVVAHKKQSDVMLSARTVRCVRKIPKMPRIRSNPHGID